MATYTPTTDFSVKDALAPGHVDKKIVGAHFDTEFDAIAATFNPKYDSDDLASTAQAQAATDNSTLMTPLRVANWADAGAGWVGEIWTMTDPAQDTLLGWDDSAGTLINGFTMGTGLGFNGTTIEISHLGFEDLTDPGGDRIPFWDDSAGNFAWLAGDSSIDISGTTVGVVDAGVNHDGLANFVANEHINHTSVTLTAGNGISGGGTIAANRTFTFAPSELSTLNGDAVNYTTDSIVVDDNGTPKRIMFNDACPDYVAGSASKTFADGDQNRTHILTGGTNRTFTLNSTLNTPARIGTIMGLICADAGKITISGSGVTITSLDGKTTVRGAGGTATLIKIAASEWVLAGALE